MCTLKGRGAGSRELVCLTTLLDQAKEMLQVRQTGQHRAGARACSSRMTVTIGACISLSRRGVKSEAVSRGRGCTRSQQGGQVGTADVLINAEVSKELGKAVLGIQARREKEGATAIVVVTQLRIRPALLQEERHHVEGILGERLVPNGRAERTKTSKQDVRTSGMSGGYTHGSAGGACRTRASRYRLRAMSVYAPGCTRCDRGNMMHQLWGAVTPAQASMLSARCQRRRAWG